MIFQVTAQIVTDLVGMDVFGKRLDGITKDQVIIIKSAIFTVDPLKHFSKQLHWEIWHR